MKVEPLLFVANSFIDEGPGRIYAGEVERFDPKPLYMRATDSWQVEVCRGKRHRTLAPPFNGFVPAIKTKFDGIVT